VVVESEGCEKEMTDGTRRTVEQKRDNITKSISLVGQHGSTSQHETDLGKESHKLSHTPSLVETET
jgi:hypothetical protein